MPDPPSIVSLIPVHSSHIQAIGYDRQAAALYVRFKLPTVATYVYRAVPSVLFDEFLQAPSKGEYFNQRIKGRYEYTIPQ